MIEIPDEGWEKVASALRVTGMTVNGVEVTPTGICVRIRPGRVEVLAAVPLERYEFEQTVEMTPDEWASLTEHIVVSDEPGQV